MSDDQAVHRLRKAVGPERPTYLRPEDTDKVMAIVLALMSEVAALRERLDTHERLAATGMAPVPDAVEAFQPDEIVEAEREAWREAYIKRLLRVMTEELEMKPGKSATPAEIAEEGNLTNG
jgi:hypothetical protein